ncbi:MAG: hypothetical protein Q9174_006909 [Haloplaca sp. 1 TL-2023]
MGFDIYFTKEEYDTNTGRPTNPRIDFDTGLNSFTSLIIIRTSFRAEADKEFGKLIQDINFRIRDNKNVAGANLPDTLDKVALAIERIVKATPRGHDAPTSPLIGIIMDIVDAVKARDGNTLALLPRGSIGGA